MFLLRLALLLIFPFACVATNLKPWFGTEYEFELRETALYQNYRSLAIPNRSHRELSHRSSNVHCPDQRTSNDLFITTSIEYPFKRYSGEFEATAAFTHYQTQRWDNFRVTGRYLLQSEAVGAPFSMVIGITLTQPLTRGLQDVSSFHHGHLEGELHLSVGKKYGPSCSSDYFFRSWGYISVGTSDIGNPWIRGELAAEYKYNDNQELRGIINGIYGAGSRNLCERKFTGYGTIKHRSVDIGMRYAYTLGCWGTVSLQYSRRVYAYNFPSEANLVLFEYYFPFGHQPAYDY